jgi:hypothetical protein
MPPGFRPDLRRRPRAVQPSVAFVSRPATTVVKLDRLIRIVDVDLNRGWF